MSRLTAAELAAIETRERAATPGPWNADTLRFIAHYPPDIAFIAHARTDVGRLLADLRAAQKAVDAAIVQRGKVYECRICGFTAVGEVDHTDDCPVRAYDASGKGAAND